MLLTALSKDRMILMTTVGILLFQRKTNTQNFTNDNNNPKRFKVLFKLQLMHVTRFRWRCSKRMCVYMRMHSR